MNFQKQIQKEDYPSQFPPPFYFVQSVHEDGDLRVVPLEGQYTPSPTNSDILLLAKKMFVRCDKSIRDAHPQGTIFAVEEITPNLNFYNSSQKLYPISEEKEVVTGKPSPSKFWKTFKNIDWEAKSKKVTENSYFDKLKKRKSYKPPTIEDDGFYIEEDKWYYLMRNCQKHIPTMIVGPTGTAKTKVLHIMSEKLGIDLSIHDMGAMQDPVAGLLGVHRLEEGKSVFDEAPFIKDIQKPGIVLLDEISRAPSAANNILFPCTDFRRRIPLALASSKQDRYIDVNESTTFFATANIGSEYVGTQELDLALKSRFEIVEFDYMPSDIETIFLSKTCNIDIKEAEKVADFASVIRNSNKEGTFSATLSTRDTMAIASLIHDGLSVANSVRLIALPLFDNSVLEDSERDSVSELIKTNLIK